MGCVIALLLAGCSAKGADPAGARAGTPSTGSGASGSSSLAVTKAAPSSLATLSGNVQPATADDARSLFASVPGGVGEAPAYDPSLVKDLDRMLAAVVAKPPSNAFFNGLSTARPQGVLVRPYVLCQLVKGAENCRASVDDYRKFVHGCEQAGSHERVEHVTQTKAGWAASGVCLWQVNPHLLSDAVAGVRADFVHLGITVRDSTGLRTLASDWAKYRVAQAGDLFADIDAAGLRRFQPRLDSFSGKSFAGCLDGPILTPYGLTAMTAEVKADIKGLGTKTITFGAAAEPSKGSIRLVFCRQSVGDR
jgi:hypothetical protein